jgi:CheY-like chemotaxis protein
VVDDHRDAARVLGLLLDALGYDVETAHDGHQALAAMAAFHPEIVLLDIGLPQIDGYEVARRVRELPALDGIKLVALTGWGHDQDRCRTREAGFDHHLVKPVAVKTLKELLARA